MYSFPAKTPKTENSNLHGFEVHRPSSKGTKLLLQVMKAIINQSEANDVCRDGNTLIDTEEINRLVVLRMNREFIQHMRKI